jgi:TPR repeat protein
MGKAFRLYQRAADCNNSWATYSLGVCYERGMGVPSDLAKAIELYHKAATLNNPLAFFNLHWLHGQGLPVNVTMACAFNTNAKELNVIQDSIDLTKSRLTTFHHTNEPFSKICSNIIKYFGAKPIWSETITSSF